MEQTRKNIAPADTSSRTWKGLFCASGILLILTAVVWTVASRTANILYACVPACALWFVLVGVQLYLYGRRMPAQADRPLAMLEENQLPA